MFIATMSRAAHARVVNVTLRKLGLTFSSFKKCKQCGGHCRMQNFKLSEIVIQTVFLLAISTDF